MGRSRTHKKLRQLVRRAASAPRKMETAKTIPMTKAYWGNWTHWSFRFSRGDAPVGLGFRVFYWKPQDEHVISVSILFLCFDVQFGVHA